jgi:hypothetical protein
MPPKYENNQVAYYYRKEFENKIKSELKHNKVDYLVI